MPDTLPQYLCIETNYHPDKAEPSPNFGMPFCEMPSIDENGNWGGPPNYIRVLGPFDLADLEQRTCAENNTTPFYYDKDGKKVNTTKGWYAVCQFNVKDEHGISVELDLPPTRSVYPAAKGPYDTKEQADEVAKEINCSRKYREAFDVCSPSPIGIGNTDLCCSLFATPIGWPMKDGVMTATFLPDYCVNSEGIVGDLNPCFRPVNHVRMGCKPSLDPVIQTCWNGLGDWENIATETGTVENPMPRGYTIRFVGEMCVTSETTVSLKMNVQWLMHPYDVNPEKPPQDPVIGSCGSFSANLKLLYPVNKHQTRIYTCDPIKFESSCLFLKQCMAYVIPSVNLMPMKFGCDGSIAGPIAERRCSLDDADSSMSCLQALVEPLVPLADVPRTVVQIIDAVGDGETVTYNCVNNIYTAGQFISINLLISTGGDSLNLQNVKIHTASNTQFTVKNKAIGTAVGPPPEVGGAIAASWAPNFFSLGANAQTDYVDGDTQSEYHFGCVYTEQNGNRIYADPPLSSDGSIIDRGDPNRVVWGSALNIENSYTVGDIAHCGFTYIFPDGSRVKDSESGMCQQIQLGGPAFLIKRGQRQIPNPSNASQYIVQYSNNLCVALGNKNNGIVEWELGTIEIIQKIGPWLAKCKFPESNRLITLYGFLYPPPVDEECPTTPPPNLSMTYPTFGNSLELSDENYEKINNLKKELEKMNKICIYLGNEIPNTKACCGSSPSYSCSKHIRCKRYGALGPQDNMACSSCPDFS